MSRESAMIPSLALDHPLAMDPMGRNLGNFLPVPPGHPFGIKERVAAKNRDIFGHLECSTQRGLADGLGTKGQGTHG